MSLLAGILPISGLLQVARGVLAPLVHRVASASRSGQFNTILQEHTDSPGFALLQQLDSDRSGNLSLAEFGGNAAGFRALDGNGNGELSLQELDMGVSRNNALKQVEASAEYFMSLHDADHDGLLTTDEAGLEADVFRALDENSDGFVSASEVQKAYGAQVGLVSHGEASS